MTGCKSCGASAPESAASGTWTCSFCKTVNFAEGFLEERLRYAAEVTNSKSIEAGIVAYEGGNYVEADQLFVDALKSESQNGDLWAYRALAISEQINLSNLEGIVKQSLRCLDEAKKLRSLTGNPEVIDAAHATAKERLVRELLRDGLRSFEQAEKIIRGYSHNQGVATSKARPKLEQALSSLTRAFEIKSPDVNQMGDVARLAVRIKRDFAVSNDILTSQINQFRQEIQGTHPSLASELTDQTDLAKSHRKSCLAPGMTLEAIDGSLIKVEELRPGMKVKTFSSKTRKPEYCSVLIVARFQNPYLIKLVTDTNELLVTPAHSVLTPTGAKKAVQLASGDKIFSQNDRLIHLQTLLSVGVVENFQGDVFWYLTKSSNYSYVNGVVLNEFTGNHFLKHLVLVKLGAWRILRAYLGIRALIFDRKDVSFTPHPKIVSR